MFFFALFTPHAGTHHHRNKDTFRPDHTSSEQNATYAFSLSVFHCFTMSAPNAIYSSFFFFIYRKTICMFRFHCQKKTASSAYNVTQYGDDWLRWTKKKNNNKKIREMSWWWRQKTINRNGTKAHDSVRCNAIKKNSSWSLFAFQRSVNLCVRIEDAMPCDCSIIE